MFDSCVVALDELFAVVVIGTIIIVASIITAHHYRHAPITPV